MKKKVISWALLIIWMIVIFFFSHQPSIKSSGVSNKVLEIIDTIIPFSLNYEWSSFVIRKLAHFTEYAILGILMIRLVNVYLKKEKNAIYFAIFCCFLYAISDEIHQLFIVGRNGNVVDVLIDTCGSMFGIFLLLIISKLLHKHV